MSFEEWKRYMEPRSLHLTMATLLAIGVSHFWYRLTIQLTLRYSPEKNPSAECSEAEVE